MGVLGVRVLGVGVLGVGVLGVRVLGVGVLSHCSPQAAERLGAPLGVTENKLYLHHLRKKCNVGC